ncbi:MAG: cytochrome P460 family protein [Planctomycetes bacterium]|nr:cytochrome P460 family protein [Planctomycetota bacterium]
MNRIRRSSNWGVFSIAAGALTIVLAVGSCTTTSEPGDSGNTGDAGESTPTGAALFTMIDQTDPFQQWGEFPDWQGARASALPHGPMSRIFINATVEAALANFEGQLPDGSIIVKENVGTSPEVTEAVLTVMWKVAGFDPENNDWFWANMMSDGQIVAEGKVQGCTACHGGARSNDFIFVQQF